MRLNTRELQNDKEFELLLKLEHSNLAEFAVENYNRKSVVRSFLNLSMLLVSLLIAVVIFKRGYSFSYIFQSFGFACLTFIPLIPFHELVHGLAYKYFGATDVRYHAMLSKLMFYAVAHGFVVDEKEFTIVAIAPFVAINLISLAIFLTFPGQLLFALFIILINLTTCSGDFALLNYVWHNRWKKVYTYDDDDNQVSYFYSVR